MPLTSSDRLRFQFIAEALYGLNGFRPTVALDTNGKPSIVGTSHLIPYPRESDERFARRNQIAWYINHLASACGRFAGYLAKRPPLRDIGNNELLRAVLDDCNWRGDDLDIFWHSFTIEAKARGSMFLLVDMPPSVPPNQQAQVDQRAVPYLVPIFPEQVTDYVLDIQGRFERVKISDRMAIDGEQAFIEREWTKSGWAIYREGKIYQQGVHLLGVCPVLIFTESGDYPCFGDYAQIADISKRVFNAWSELDELLRGQTFSILLYKVPQDRFGLDLTSITATLGVSNMLQTFETGAEFIGPDAANAATYMQVIALMEQKINDIALIVEATNQAESGIALTLRFQALNASLVGFARRLEDLERRMWDLVCRWLRIDNRVQVSWSKDYAIADVGKELEVLAAMQASALPDEVLREQQKAVVSAQFGAADNAVMDRLIIAIEAPVQEPTP